MPSNTFNFGSIALGIRRKDALLWRGSIDTRFRPNDEGKIIGEKGET
jgi:predicted RNA-binding protein YlqC (UPF0109 family)